MLDVILPIYNTPDIEDRCIRYLLTPGGMPEGARLIVVDDCSPNPETFLKWGSVLDVLGHRAVRRTGNGGCHAAWNTGIREARHGADIALIGSDVVVPPGALRRLHELTTALDVDLVGARDASAETWDPEHALGPLIAANANDMVDAEFEGCITSCCVIRAGALERVGLFDEQFRITFGDSDWNQRARDAGCQLVTVNNVVVFHGKSVTRKRLGVDFDLEVDMADHHRFLEKWKDRPDVTAQHPLSEVDITRLSKAYCWEEGES